MGSFVLSFASIHDAMAAEKAFLDPARSEALEDLAGAELLPLPPSIKSDCGYGLYFGSGVPCREILAALGSAAVVFEAAYAVSEEIGERGKKEKRYERFD